MVYGQNGWRAGGFSTFGACLNPALALAVSFTSVMQSEVDASDAFKYMWLYPVFPFLGSACALLFYEFVFKKAREVCQQGEEEECEGEEEHHDPDQP